MAVRIGEGSEAMLYNEPCVQQYGSYFNRVRTIEPDPNDISYVFGECNAKCGDDYLDTANQVRTVAGGIPPFPGEMVVGRPAWASVHPAQRSARELDPKRRAERRGV